MPRALDDPIPETESLYRAVENGDIEGTVILDGAVDDRRCSFNRAKYSPSLYTVLRTSNPGNAERVGETKGERIDKALKIESVQEYQLHLVDDPLDGNDAHCEIQAWRASDKSYNNSHKMNKQARKLMQARIAAAMVLLPLEIPPKPLDSEERRDTWREENEDG